MMTGKSYLSNASTTTTPMPFQSKTYSTKTAPANKEANQPETAVTTGFKALRKAWIQMTRKGFKPLARAVRT